MWQSADKLTGNIGAGFGGHAETPELKSVKGRLPSPCKREISINEWKSWNQTQN
jgi:hypothetical protein